MLQTPHTEISGAEPDSPGSKSEDVSSDFDSLRSRAREFARSLPWLPGQSMNRPFWGRCRALRRAFKPLLVALDAPAPPAVSNDFRALYDNVRLLDTELEVVQDAFRPARKTPLVAVNVGVIPRVAALAEDLLSAVEYRFAEPAVTAYLQGFQESTVLKLVELQLFASVLKLILLEKIAERGLLLLQDSDQSCGMDDLVHSLRDVTYAGWRSILEPLIAFDHTLRQDPAGAYAGMDYESREFYRKKLVNIADHSDCSEMEVASAALDLARQAQKHPDPDPRVTLRRSHIGCYLVAEGSTFLEQRVGFRPPITQRVHAFLRVHPEELHLPGIALLTSALILGVVLILTEPHSSLGLILFATLAVLLPCSQSAVQIVNSLVTLLLPAEILPKLDFSAGLPSDCVTLVAVPTVFLNEKQVRKLVENLEVRFLGNQDPNLYFALLTDLPDSPFEPSEASPLVELCAELMQRLNQRYGGEGMGPFLWLHRRRVYNPREKLWMGWERKRGKLMELNNLLRGQADGFSGKIGKLSIFPDVRFVITLDSDTELPRGAAHRMAGTLAHPLNQAILDPEKGIVVAGYGILQPRVGVSVQSTSRSRLASIYSGQTGFDIYTRAVSDVYQDLYGEGIFVGKGIYEVETLHRVLDRRFPRNALLSHDLVEGAYARAALVSDIEVIEDYPSHYSAYNRRKHRWLRGDWQIAGWLRTLVPEESGRRVHNPISLTSQWKILDNLRRSLVEPAIFLLLVLGWLCLPGRPLAWTVATIAILFLPAWCQLVLDLIHAVYMRKRAIAADAVGAFFDANVADLLTLTFLAHQALLSIDAVVRTVVRRVITRQRLLQWETAAQAELAGYKRTVLDVYLDLTPVVALGLLLVLWVARRAAVPAAAPILFLWAFSKPVSIWLNRPPRAPRKQASERDRRFLRGNALRVWRYFAEFATEEHHWLIPDNVQGDPLKIAPRISPTNLGFLLNARQVACQFGYLTLPEFTQQTLRTLATVSRMEHYRGHLFNWYDTRTLLPLSPVMVSSVDSGNLLASLWTLQQGCLDCLDQPLLPRELADGSLDHLRQLSQIGVLRGRRFSSLEQSLRSENWLAQLLAVDGALLADASRRAAKCKGATDAPWFAGHAELRIKQVHRTVTYYAPWLLPEFAALSALAAFRSLRPENVPLQLLPAFIDNLSVRLRDACTTSVSEESCALHNRLLALLPEARTNVLQLIDDLNKISSEAGRLADQMDFRFLLNRKRGLLSIGFHVTERELHSACYDLLATESRIAVFAAIAKDDIPQETWFLLGRPHALDHGHDVLLSWTGTMFEYLMPAIWMRTYPNTLLERATEAAVRSQRAYVAQRRIPWGISESSYSRTDEAGDYHYYAFGVPTLALSKVEPREPVISPYSTFLALHVDPTAAFENLYEMADRRWMGPYGFYEAVDFHPSRRRWFRRSEPVRCWMAHHQGMCLLSIANFLQDDLLQRWFHSHPRVQATELLLQEKPTAHPRPLRRGRIRAA